jgi:(p)ppGpp synthase/HD superfamily hydrolase
VTYLVAQAQALATGWHSGQVRKYTGEPYINHPREVANLVSDLPESTAPMIAAAYLHDVVEDTECTLAMLRAELGKFGPLSHQTVDLVYWLTDASTPADGNRAARKAIDRAHIAKAPTEAKTIKLADLISNTSSIVRCDPEFAVVYLAEKRLLLPELNTGNQVLFQVAKMLAKDIHLAA